MRFRDLALAVSSQNLIFFMKLLCEKTKFFVFFKLHHKENGVQRLGTGSVLLESHILKLLCEKDKFSLCFRLHHRENGVQRLGTGSVLPESHIFHETALNFITEKMRSRDLILFSQWLVLLSLNF